MVVHICNNYISSKVHFNLIKAISYKKSFPQKVFVPIRTQKDRGVFFMDRPDVDIVYSYYPDFFRYFPIFKVLFNFFMFYWKVSSSKDFGRTKHVVAHTLWSDGLIAYFSHLVWGVPYSVVVRNTDMNTFLPKLPHYRWLLKRVIKRSSNLVFVNSSYREKMKDRYPGLYGSAKSVSTIHNGLDEYWIENQFFDYSNERKNVCFVGGFNKNKNILNIYKSVLLARKFYNDINLILVGGDAESFKVLAEVSSVPEWVYIQGYTKDKNLISKYLRSSFVFLMPSYKETFGLVYLEALSQGCRLICSKGEAVDGVLDDDFLLTVSPDNAFEIMEAVVLWYERRSESFNRAKAGEVVLDHAWGQIADNYLRMIG